MSMLSVLSKLRFCQWTVFSDSFPDEVPYMPCPSNPEKPSGTPSVYDVWLASRSMTLPNGQASDQFLVPGASRQISISNLKLAYTILCSWTFGLMQDIFGLHPLRTLILVALNITRSLFPAFRGYSQALIIDEIQHLFTSGEYTWTRIFSLILTEVVRRCLEAMLESFAASNERVVLTAAKYHVEYEQIKHRVKLDLPTLSDPVARDLLQESDLFVRSFNGSGFGLISPLDFMQIICIVAEIVSHVLLVLSLTKGAAHVGILLLSIIPTALPLVLRPSSFFPDLSDSPYSDEEVCASNRQEKMRNLAYSDAHRPEIALFGLGPWILNSWAQARKTVINSELSHSNEKGSSLFQANFSDLIFAAQNLPYVLLMQSTSTSLGSLTLYRSSIQAVIFASRNLMSTTRMAFQSIFLMSAFCASMELRPQLDPADQDYVPFRSLPDGMRIEARNISFTYPGCQEPTLKDVSFTLEAGESLAIVGENGSGKTTLSKILFRLVDFEGELLINGIDIRRYKPEEYHRHLSGVLQNFSKWNSTVTENVGVGNVKLMALKREVLSAVRLAEADNLVSSLPNGLGTMLETPGFESMVYPGSMHSRYPSLHHGLSGGEWQRLALARSFMRAKEPEVGLLVYDEPTSSLDAHAQKTIFETILGRVSQTPRRKTVVFVTHRLSTARKANRIAMMENGTITEFGTHDDLVRCRGAYYRLHLASIE